MTDQVIVTGMVIFTAPVNDYDRRIIILTKERGKITVFAKGARRQGSRMLAATNPFCFGNFKLYEGKTAYNLIEANISNYFEELRSDFSGAYLGMYFLEFADYYSRENNDEVELLKLLYQTIRAVIKESIDNRLIKVVYEMKIMVINGEFPGIPKDRPTSKAAAYTIDFITRTPVEKLYTFKVSDEVLEELSSISDMYRNKYIDKHFKSLDLIGDFEL